MSAPAMGAVANIFSELKAGSTGNSVEAGIQWKNIQLREGLGERRGGRDNTTCSTAGQQEK
jgi:hypothetical protein